MSSTVVYFFPTGTKWLQEHDPVIWSKLFASAVQTACPRQVKRLTLPWAPHQPIDVAWPLLIPIALFGVLVGFGIALLLLLPPDALLRRRLGGSSVVHLGWPLSFLFFAAMNISAIPSHCTQPTGSQAQLLATAIDVAMTSASCLSAAFAALASWDPSPPDPERAAKRWLVPLLALDSGLVAVAVPASLANTPWANEFFYLGVLAVSLLIVAIWLLRQLTMGASERATRRGALWAAAAGTCAVLCLICPTFDATMCRAFGSSFNMLHFSFLGCDLMFVALGGFLLCGAPVPRLQVSK